MTGTVVAAVLAAGVGFGLLIVARGARRRPPDLAAVVARPLDGQPLATPVLTRSSADRLSGFQRSFSRPGLRVLETLGLVDRGILRSQLEILGKSVERHAYEKMLAGLAGILLPLGFWAGVSSAGVGVSPALVVVASIVLGGLGFLYPDLPLADRVADRQRAFRHSLSAYLDLVTIILAGGGGTESALVGAAEAGDGWVFGEIRSALRRGELTGRTPWEMFDELGARFGIDELRELAASVSLAGGHGARVRQSLVAKAEAMRARQAADVEAMAESNTEKMIVPVSIMVLGLMVFIGRGAVDAIGGRSAPPDLPTPAATADAPGP